VINQLVREIAESILEIGQQTPILARPDGDRYVLVEGLHRLEACKALGEHTIMGYSVSARVSTPTVKSPYETDLEGIRQKTERLRELRLAKQAAEQAVASTGKGIEKPVTPDSRGESERVRTARSSKKASLLDWLAEREHDGFVT
jgi:ParB-like nuclease domain